MHHAVSTVFRKPFSRLLFSFSRGNRENFLKRGKSVQHSVTARSAFSWNAQKRLQEAYRLVGGLHSEMFMAMSWQSGCTPRSLCAKAALSSPSGTHRVEDPARSLSLPGTLRSYRWRYPGDLGRNGLREHKPCNTDVYFVYFSRVFCSNQLFLWSLINKKGGGGAREPAEGCVLCL